MAAAVSSSLSRPPIRDDFDREIIGELGSKAPIQSQVSALHDEKAHSGPSGINYWVVVDVVGPTYVRTLPRADSSTCDIRGTPEPNGAGSGSATHRIVGKLNGRPQFSQESPVAFRRQSIGLRFLEITASGSWRSRVDGTAMTMLHYQGRRSFVDEGRLCMVRP
jgi:hypothetical protein